MSHDLEMYRRLRDIGNLLILVGILAEIAIDIFWPERSTLFPTLREYSAITPFLRWWDHIRSWRVLAMFVAGMVVLAGLMYERVEGENADQVADQLLTDAITGQTKLERFIAGRQIVRDLALAKLCTFAGTPIWVAAIGPASFPSHNTIFEAESFSKISTEAVNFADSFSEVERFARWKFHRVNEAIDASGRSPGVTVYSWRPLRDKAPTSDVQLSPSVPDSSEKRAWAAADALVIYLKDDLRLARTRHLPVQIGSQLMPPFDKWNPPPPFDAVVVLVGANDPENELEAWLRRREHIPGQPP
jgi:hypothetical protein